MKYTDITDKVEFQNEDDEILPLTKCACGQEFEPWSFTISIYSSLPDECPNCNRKLFFESIIKVYEITEDEI